VNEPYNGHSSTEKVTMHLKQTMVIMMPKKMRFIVDLFSKVFVD